MISTGLAIAFLLEALVFSLVCLWLWDLTIAGHPVGMVLTLILLAVVGLRIATVWLEFLISFLAGLRRHSEHRLGCLGGIYLVAVETLAFLLVIFLLMPMQKRVNVLRRGAVSHGQQAPVLFIHGYAMNAGVWAPMVNYLSRVGLANLYTMNLRPHLGDLDEYARQVAERVARICTTTGAPKVVLVGHSMGGLVARAYVARCGGAGRVAKVVSIGAPHHGTLLARFVPGRNARQMHRGSAWLRDLNRDENVRGAIDHVSVWSPHDNIIIPQASAEVGMARNIVVPGKGHFHLIMARAVGDIVYREVRSATAF
jgi:pimeloyl-ACP methyl ester carboxylesterase